MSIDEIFVFAHLQDGFVPAGRLSLTQGARGVEASSFAYGLRYLGRPGSFEIDPVSLSLADREAAHGVELRPVNNLPEFGGVRDAAPDAWGRRVIEARRKVPANSLPEAAYLIDAGRDRMGALDVRPSLEDGGRPGTAPVQNLGYLLKATERIETGEPVPARLTDLFGSGPGAGGARPKAAVRDDMGLLWLAKFPSRSDTFDMATAEYATLRLAALCGMSVPEVRVADIGGKSVLLIRRFDRYWHEGQDLPSSETVLHDTLPGARAQERRLPFVSGLTLLAGDEFESRFKALRRPEPRGTSARAPRPHPCRQQGALCADGLQHLRQQRRRPSAQPWLRARPQGGRLAAQPAVLRGAAPPGRARTHY
jgi:serine/threonine-protein kinase HipA